MNLPTSVAPASTAVTTRGAFAHWLVGVGLFLLTCALYSPVLRYGFICLDDWDYVVGNRHVHGLSQENSLWAFTHFHSSNWHPLTWLSHALDWSLWGPNPAGHHLTNVLIHAASSALLFLVLMKATGARWRSVWVAALFAWHPLHVESVAWIAERKDVLSGLFWVLTVLAYIYYARQPSWRRGLLVGLSFAAGLLAKPMLVTLPFVLLLLDLWPLNRINFSDTVNAVPNARRLVLEKLPLFLLSAASCVITFVAQKSSGAISSLEQVSFPTRLANTLVSYTSYVGKTLWPVDLAVFYPFQPATIGAVLGAAFFLTAVTIVTVLAARRAPFIFVGWFLFLGSLIPVIGLVQVGAQAMADRYTYLPLIGLFIVTAWDIPQVLHRWKPVAMAFAGLSLALCFITTNRQLQHWRDSRTLLTHSLAVTPSNAFAQRLLADAFMETGNSAEAIGHYPEALRMNPADADANNNLGLALRQSGKIDEAIPRIQEALKLRPNFPKAHDNLATALLLRGEFAEAVAHYQEALRLNPDLIESCNNLAWLRATSADAKFRNGKEAIRLAQRAIELEGTETASSLDTLAAALAETGHYDNAIDTANRARQLASAAQQDQLATSIAARLEQYQRQQPYRATW